MISGTQYFLQRFNAEKDGVSAIPDPPVKILYTVKPNCGKFKVKCKFKFKFDSEMSLTTYMQ